MEMGLRPNKLGIAQTERPVLAEGQSPSAHQPAEPESFWAKLTGLDYFFNRAFWLSQWITAASNSAGFSIIRKWPTPSNT